MRLKYPLVLLYFIASMALISLIGRPSEVVWDDLMTGETYRYMVWGLVNGLFCLAMHMFPLRKRLRRYMTEFPGAETEPIDSSKVTQRLIVPRSCAATFELCRDSVASLNGARIASEDRNAGAIKARVGFSWSSFGERIEFRLTPIGDRFTELEVRSRPVWGTSCLDGGRNLDNITSICAFVRDQTKTVHMGELKAA